MHASSFYKRAPCSFYSPMRTCIKHFLVDVICRNSAFINHNNREIIIYRKSLFIS
uniref:Uncharacterized protein n=1 Tax=Anguilla anguilla TaxID=7936 RepID=A0A0E9RRR5_ANGAN